MHCALRPTRRLRPLFAMVAAVAAVATSSANEAAAQLPAIKSEVQGLEPFECVVGATPPSPAPGEARQAAELGSSARQAVILGDLERGSELLARATSLDPASATLAYQYGRVLEDLGDDRAAVGQYCRALALGADNDDASDARGRIDAWSDATRRRVPPAALEAFRAGVAASDERRWSEALTEFASASEAHADFPEAEFDRAVALEALGRGPEAADAYRSYLALRPDAPDVIAVSERIGQLQVVQRRPSPGSALALGILLPGGGQFYTGRPLGGVALLAAAGGAAAAGFLIEEVDVRCLRAVEPGQACPPEEVLGRTTSRPYLVWGLAGAGAVLVGGAIEAFLHSRGLDDIEMASLGADARLLGPSLRARGLGADVRFFRVTF